MSVAMHLVWLARPSCLWDGLANWTSHHAIEPQIHSSVSQHYKEVHGGEGQRAIKPYVICPLPPFRETLTLPPFEEISKHSTNYMQLYVIDFYAVRVGVNKHTVRLMLQEQQV